MEIAAAVLMSTSLEFLLVSSDYETLNEVSAGIKRHGGRLILMPTADAALDYLNRRKIDAVFVDLEVPGALGLIESIRKGSSNSNTVIFVCLTSSAENTLALNVGANFLLRTPLHSAAVELHIVAAKQLLVRERRRYFRHPVKLSVLLREGEVEQIARMTNLSEAGMAVHTVKPLRHSCVVHFAFEFSVGVRVSGRGRVAWTNKEGIAGIALQTFHGKGREHLEAWLTAQEHLNSSNIAVPR
jgi:CheY-like chemotaxis protein